MCDIVHKAHVPWLSNSKEVMRAFLQGMGFYDRQANIMALQATGGNVNAAVDRLLQGP